MAGHSSNEKSTWISKSPWTTQFASYPVWKKLPLDVDGIVVVPQDLAEEVILKAWEKVNGESKVRDALRAGASVTETFAKYRIL